MSGFLDLQRINVRLDVAEVANEFLRAMGERQSEGFALWVGNRDGTVFDVKETVIPAQTGHVLEDGVCVSVDSHELHRLNVDLYSRRMNVIAQLHSHPGAAYHSNTDDCFPIATTVGCLSIVVPDFARFPFSLRRCAVYRLTQEGNWSFLSAPQVEALVTIL